MGQFNGKRYVTVFRFRSRFTRKHLSFFFQKVLQPLNNIFIHSQKHSFFFFFGAFGVFLFAGVVFEFASKFVS